jgi:succinate dehydrogenase / fumarate reductase iron-sulfur subunit
MLVNGKPMLACNTQILDVSDKALTLAPLPNFEIIKDLVPDLNPLFERHVASQPYIQREDKEEMDTPTGQFFQSPHELEAFLQFTYCIKCGCCMAACPTMATDPEYLGPVALAQAYRYNTDTRDGGFKSRKKNVASAHGAFSCHYAGECSNVCPKGVDPARAIQLMKKDLVLDYLKLKRKQEPSEVLGPPIGEKKPPIEFPPFTVEQK